MAINQKQQLGRVENLELELTARELDDTDEEFLQRAQFVCKVYLVMLIILGLSLLGMGLFHKL